MAIGREKSSSSVFLDTTSAQSALDKLNKKVDEYDKKLKQTNLTQREITSLQKDRAAAAEKAATVQLQIEKGLGATLVQQKKYIQDLNKEMSHLAVGTQEWIDKTKQIAAANATLAQMKTRLGEVSDAQSKVSKLSNAMASFFGNVLANVALRAATAVKAFFVDSFDEALEAEEKTARLHNTLNNLGRTDVFDRMIAKAEEMARRFTYLDNDEVLGVFKQLIDYGKLTEKQMDDLLPVIIDFAANARISVEESTSVILKALEGNGKGLKEYGIDIKDAKTETERLNIVMTTLADKVKGAGEAFQGTTAGGLASANQEFKNLKEEIGTGIIPIINKLLTVVNDAIKSLKFLKNAISDALGNKSFDATRAQFTIDSTESGKQAVEDNVRGERALLLSMQNELKKAQAQGRLLNKTQDDINKEFIQHLEQQTSNAVQKWQLMSQSGVKTTRAELQSLYSDVVAKQKLLSELTNTVSTGIIGVSQPDGETDAEKRAREKAEKEREEELKKQQEFIEKVDKLYAESKAQSAIDKDLLELSFKYAELRKQAEEQIKDEILRHETLIRIEESFQLERLKLIAKYGQFAKDQYEEINNEISKKQDEILKRTHKNIDELSKRLETDSDTKATAGNELRDQTKALKLALDIAQSFGKKKLDLQKKQLKKEQEEEIASFKERGEAAGLGQTAINEGIAEINRKFREKEAELERQTIFDKINSVLDYAKQALDIINAFNQRKNDQENAELAREQKNNDKRKASLQRLLNAKVISQQEYYKRTKSIDDEYDEKVKATKKKQWERQHKADIAQAIIGGAQAVIAGLQTKPFFPLGLIMGALAGVLAGIQISNVVKQKPPEFEKGTILRGPSHRQGGIDLVDSRSGRKVAEAEGGELLLSKNFVKKNPDLSSQLLHASQRNNGDLAPFWKNRPYKGIDVTSISRSIQRVRHFESGGVITASSNTQSGTFNQDAGASNHVLEMNAAVIANLQQTIMQLNQELQKPRKNYVVHKDIVTAQEIEEKIKEDAIFK